MKAPSGECNGVIGAGDVSENKNVTTRLSCWCGPGAGPHSEWPRAGLGDLAEAPPPALHRPPTDRGVRAIPRHLPWDVFVYFLFMGRSDGGLALSPSDLQYCTESSLHSRMLAPGKKRSGPRRLSRAPVPIEQLYRPDSLDDKRRQTAVAPYREAAR